MQSAHKGVIDSHWGEETAQNSSQLHQNSEMPETSELRWAPGKAPLNAFFCVAAKKFQGTVASWKWLCLEVKFDVLR